MPAGQEEIFLEKLLTKVKLERNLDFSQYRKTILARRVMARARMSKQNNIEEYFFYLNSHPQEMDYLMEVLTINVTEFFRDRKVFEIIENEIIPEIIKKKKMAGSHEINVWSCASSSGEEAYSVLMLFSEYLGRKLEQYKLVIHGTDIDNTALAKAREGVYERYQFRNLSVDKKALLDKYFYDMGNNRYWIREEWPGYMDFKYHDVISDPPLENIDMALCRNLFIYFGRDLQSKVLENLCQSLVKGGFLVMGIVESMFGPVKEKFIEYNRQARIYIKK